MIERLNKFLAAHSNISRRKADEAILAGQVNINGEIVRELGTKIDPDTDIVLFNNEMIGSSQDSVYYALYKPVGVVSTASDEAGRQAVVDLVPKEPRVYPVGRLDIDSEGLIILTNDGELTNRLTHPSFEHEKEYRVTARIKNKELRIKPEQIEKTFVQGLKIDGKLMKMDSVLINKLNSVFLILNSVLHTGYNRQIRRMCAKIGLEVTKLIRIRVGKLALDTLRLTPGQYKVIKKADIIDV